MKPAARSSTKRKPRRDLGRLFARVLCVIFAVAGLVPVIAIALTRTRWVRTWAANETARVLQHELGIEARYEVSVRAWPTTVSLENVVVDAEGGGPFLEIERVSVRPRIFSLLAGQLDAGAVEIVGPRAHVVVRGGELVNLRLRPPESDGKRTRLERAPFGSVEVLDARLDLDVDGALVVLREVDVDVTSEGGLDFEASVRAGRGATRTSAPLPGAAKRSAPAVYEDVLCRFDARVRLSPEAILIRRLAVVGAMDFEIEEGTAPACELAENDWRRFELRLNAVRGEIAGIADRVHGASAPEPVEPRRVSGHVELRAGLGLVHRFVDLRPVTGAIAFAGEIEWERGATLPTAIGKVEAWSPGYDSRVILQRATLEIEVGGDSIKAKNIDIHAGDGTARIAQAVLKPFDDGVPIKAGPIAVDDMQLTSFLRDVGIHPRPHVELKIDTVRIAAFGGTLSPFKLSGELDAKVRDFAVNDRPAEEPERQRIVGTKSGSIRATLEVRSKGIAFLHGFVEAGQSRLNDASVAINFNDTLDIAAETPNHIDFGDFSPLGGVELAGLATVTARGGGPIEDPHFEGKASVSSFRFAGLDVGDVEAPDIKFHPLEIDFLGARVKKNASVVRVHAAHIDLAHAGGSVVADAKLDTREAPFMSMRDLFQIFAYDKDPRFADLSATIRGDARVHFVVGGPTDRCGGGVLDLASTVDLDDASLFGEHFESGRLESRLAWDDFAAGTSGMELEVRSANLRKGPAQIVGAARVSHGGFVRGSAVGSGVPLGHIDALGPGGKLLDGTASFVAELGGTLAKLEARADVELSPIRLGVRRLPPSRLRVRLDPEAAAKNPLTPKAVAPLVPTTRCGNARSSPFDRAAYDRDPRQGVFRATGSLFEGQVKVDDLSITQQRNKVVSGRIRFDGLDLGTALQLAPGVAFAQTPPEGSLRAALDIKHLPLAEPTKAELALTLQGLDLKHGGSSLSLAEAAEPATLALGSLRVPELRFDARTASGVRATIAAAGKISRIESKPEVDASIKVLPIDLARLSRDIPQIARAAGTAVAELRATGPLESPRFAGSAHLQGGSIALKSHPVRLDDIEIDVEVGDSEVRVSRATARYGSGTIAATGSAPLRGFELGTLEARVIAQSLKLPLETGLDVTANADLAVTYTPRSSDASDGSLEVGASGDAAARVLPDVKGTVTVTTFRYTRPIALSLNLSSIGGKKQRTEVESYSPANDFLRFYVRVVASKPLVLTNNLVDMKLEIAKPGLVLSGTNQRFGARGSLRILPDSTLALRGNSFEVREGAIRFDDPFRVAPKVDVRAQTEFRRAATSGDGGPAGAPVSASAGDSASKSGGQWRINLHAQGDAEDLKLRLSSDPPLSQDDIILLLTIGLTRAEIDRGLATSLGETVGLEALSALTGADKAVKEAVPLIDEFRFGSGYSSRTGRTEPTVTLGKRLTSAVRASVTTGLSENRSVRSSIEVRVGKRTSVQGSYDSVNDVSNSPLGNVGADLRWRLEFE